MKGLLEADKGQRGAEVASVGWPRAASRILLACMLLLGAAAAWLVLTRPVHRIEGDFLEREDRQVADEWLLENLRHPVAELRARALLAWARVRGRAALDALLQGMRDPAPSVRARAAFATGNAFDPRSGAGDPPERATAALAGLLQDDERRVATRAVEALGKMRWRQAAAAVTRTAAPIVTAMTALIRMDARSQSEFVAEYLDSDDQDSRWAAALAARELRLLRVPLVWERLRPLVTDDNDFVRSAALRAVSGGVADNAMLASVRKSLGHPDPKVRFEAGRALAGLAGSPAPEPLPSGEPLLASRAVTPPDIPLLDRGDYQRVAKTLGVRLRLSTTLGDFEIELDYDQAPITSEHFRRLAAGGAMDGAAFSAVRPNGYAVVAAKLDPIRSELNPKPFLRGSIGLLRQGRASGGGFFLCLTGLPLADGRYVNFGRCVSGDKHLDRIAAGTLVRSIRELR